MQKLSTIDRIKTIIEAVTFNSETQEFIDKNGKDRKHYKTKSKRWYVSVSIDRKQYTVAAHQIIYYINNPHLEELPSLTFKDNDQNNLCIDNIVIYDTPVVNGIIGMEGFIRLYFNESDKDKLIALLKDKNITFAASKKAIKQKNNTKSNKAIKQKSKGIFPIKCGNSFALICSESNLIQLDHSGPNL